MAGVAKCLPIILIPEQGLVHFVGNNVVNIGGPYNAPDPIAGDAKRVLPEKMVTSFAPAAVIIHT